MSTGSCLTACQSPLLSIQSHPGEYSSNYNRFLLSLSLGTGRSDPSAQDILLCLSPRTLSLWEAISNPWFELQQSLRLPWLLKAAHHSRSEWASGSSSVTQARQTDAESCVCIVSSVHSRDSWIQTLVLCLASST